MNYTKLGKSDLNISRITLGTWAIGGSNWGKSDEPDAVKAIEASIDEGINFIDTAPAYGGGRAEKLIGDVIKNKRNTVLIATKCGLDIKNGYRKDLSPEFIERDLSASLKRLQTDYIDLYQCHWPVTDTPIEKTMEALVKFQKQGKIRYIGLSNFNREEITKSMMHAEIISLQSQYSLLDRSIEKDIQKICLDNNISIITYGSLGAGVLTGKYSERPKFGDIDARSFFYPFFQENRWEQTKSLVEEIEKIASGRNARPSQIAIAWLLTRKGVASALVGARNPEQAAENTGGTTVKLTSEELDTLDNISESN